MAKGANIGAQDASLRRFVELLGTSREETSLFELALLLAAIDRPELRDGWWRVWLTAFDDMTERIADEVSAMKEVGEGDLLQAWARVFSSQLRFRAPTGEYHLPAHSSLAYGLERRTGLPITLSVLFAELGRQALGLRTFGVPTPGHFIAGAWVGSEMYFVDPFSTSGRVLSATEAAIAVAERTGRPADFIMPYLRPATWQEILVRMVNNLRAAYERQQSVAGLERALEWLLVLEPGNQPARRDRGLALLYRGQLDHGARLLLEYLESSPGAEDEALIRREAMKALSARHLLN